MCIYNCKVTITKLFIRWVTASPSFKLSFSFISKYMKVKVLKPLFETFNNSYNNPNILKLFLKKDPHVSYFCFVMLGNYEPNTYKYKQIPTNTYKYKQIHTNTYKYIQIHTNTYNITALFIAASEDTSTC